MKVIKYFYAIVAFAFILNSCSKEPDVVKDPFIVSFKETSINFNKIKDNYKVQLVFSNQPSDNGSIIIRLEETEMTYGVDYETIPAAVDGKLEVLFNKGDKSLDFTYVSLIAPTSNKRKLSLIIDEVNYEMGQTQGYTEFVMSFEESSGGVFLPTIGGPNEPNQVFIDFSSKTEKLVKRDSWSLGFLAEQGKFNVILNETNYSAAGAVEFTDIDAVKESDFEDLKGDVTLKSNNPKYIDDPERDFSKNAIAAISANENDNKVYLLNLGNKVPNVIPEVGSAGVAGEALGWMKIRVLRKDNGYLLQYAKLADTTHKEVFIPKSTEGYTFTYFDFKTEKIVKVAPRKTDWDISFTVFSNVMIGRDGTKYAYGYSDFVYSNKLGGVKIYSLNEEEDAITYDGIDKSNVDATKLEGKRGLPGSSWRSVFTKTVKPIFYVLQDPDGNLYKLRFLQLVNEKGERGYSKFEYKLLK